MNLLNVNADQRVPSPSSALPPFRDSAILSPPIKPSAPSPRPAGHPSPTGRGVGGEGEQSATLLEGFRLLLHFLLDAEANFLCGTPLHAKSPTRTNHRLGYYSRRLVTPIGSFSLRVPHLRFFHPRVSILKRARRLAPEILDTLATAYGAPSPRTSSTPLPLGEGQGVRGLDELASKLIELVWTLELPDELLAKLTAQLSPILEEWKRTSRPLSPDRLKSQSTSQAVGTPASTALAAY